MRLMTSLLEGPAAYVPRTGWTAFAAIPAGALMFIAAALFGAVAADVYTTALGLASPRPSGASLEDPRVLVRLLVWVTAMQAMLIMLTLAAASLFGSRPAAALALRAPAGGPRSFVAALVLLIGFLLVYTTLISLVSPRDLGRDIAPFARMIRSDAWWLTLAAVGVGAPLAEELFFRGFLFSALARSRAGIGGATALTAGTWAALHAGYSVFGMIEVVLIALYFSWLLVRTGSLWVPIFCHATYNTVLILALRYLPLPSGIS
jgi:membrane protease YdiL (CAAX protease family)